MREQLVTEFLCSRLAAVPSSRPARAQTRRAQEPVKAGGRAGPATALAGDPNGPSEACPLIRSHAR
jgi:hypothetical protein